jgi:hypothetical protein
MRMAERWQQFYLRALEALRRLRRASGPAVVVRRAAQVNFAQQQLNLGRG